MRHLKFIVPILLIFLFGCATKYQPFSLIGGGYIEKKREDGVFWLKYTGATAGEPVETIKNFWRKRANELCGSEPKEMDYKQVRVAGIRTGGFGQASSAPSPVVEGHVYC